MKSNNNIWLLLVAGLAFLLIFMNGTSSARYAGETDAQISTIDGTADFAGASEKTVLPEASVKSYYVVNDDFYILMQKPMAKAYAAFSIVPVIVSDVADHGSMGAETPILSREATQHSDAESISHAADSGNETLNGVDLALNLKFKRPADRLQDIGSDLDSPQVNDDIADPVEPINRVFFTFNDKLYFWVLKPAAHVYGFFVPEWGRARVRNVFENIQAPVRMVNALFQFKMNKFGAEFSSFALNSTVGIGGLFDIASRHPELKTGEEDLGQTFGYYGLGEGFYLVLPFLGPSSLRDAAGFAGDYFLDPLRLITPLQDAIAVRTFDKVNDTSLKIGDYEDIKESAVDPYISIRDMYKQYRRSKIRD